MSVTAAKWIDSWARLQFRFFLNLFGCLLTTNLSQTNHWSHTGLQTLSKKGNRQWIPITPPQQDANDSLFILRPWCNAIRVRTPPHMCLIYSQVVWRSVISSHDLRSLKVHGTFRKMFVLLKVTICVFVELTDRNWPKRWMNLGVQVYQVQVSRVHLYQETTKWSKFESFQSLKMHYESGMRLCTCTTTNKVENIPNCLLRGRMISA